MKKLLNYYFIYLIFSCSIPLDGFDFTNNKFKIHCILKDQKNWGNLFVEGFEVDYKAAQLAETKLQGGYFDEKIHSVVPGDFLETENEWKATKDQIAYLIGPLSQFSGIDNNRWKNTAKSVDELLQHADYLAPDFIKDFETIAFQKQVIANFGPGNEFIVKSQQSLIRKVEQNAQLYGVSHQEAISKIGDVLRGTLIVDEIEKIPEIITLINEYAAKRGAKIALKNLWAEDRESGYVGIHAKLLLPVSQSGANHYVVAEMQIHLDSIVDGTAMSAKERAHMIYEESREDQSSSLASSLAKSAASKLLFLTAMQEALEKLQNKESG